MEVEYVVSFKKLKKKNIKVNINEYIEDQFDNTFVY